MASSDHSAHRASGAPGYAAPGAPFYTGNRPTGPSSGGAIGALLGGGFLSIITLAVWMTQAHNGYVAAFFSALFLGATLWLAIYGIAKLAKKKLPIAATGGIIGGVALLGGIAGPSISGGYYRSQEATLYRELSSPSTPSVSWNRYEKDIPAEFQRKGWQNEKYLAKVRESKSSAKALRDAEALIVAEKDQDAVKGAKDAAQKALGDLYDGGKARLYAPPKTGSTPEFPVDDKLRSAFSQVLVELAQSTDPNIYVAFETSSDLTAPKGTDASLKEYREDPEARESFPKGDAPIIDQGDAFSPTYDVRRRGTFISATSESFAKVFDAELISLVPLEKGADTKDKIVIDVTSKITRSPDFFFYTRETTPGVKKVAGLLFAIDVAWGFKIVDKTGKTLYEAPLARSKAANEVSISRKPSDPQWALYSIMMDSAYYNYSREMAGRFGFDPPPVKDAFEYVSN